MMKAIWKARNSDDKGFTLVELLVVIAILGILAGVAVFAIGGTTGKSKGAACNTDVGSVQTASDAFTAASATSAVAANPAALVPTYLRVAPNNPAYVISISSTGLVTATPACSTF
jgi:prepilin-type N-terminal cleavage/methylation domain-containing protein